MAYVAKIDKESAEEIISHIKENYGGMNGLGHRYSITCTFITFTWDSKTGVAEIYSNFSGDDVLDYLPDGWSDFFEKK